MIAENVRRKNKKQSVIIFKAINRFKHQKDALNRVTKSNRINPKIGKNEIFEKGQESPRG